MRVRQTKERQQKNVLSSFLLGLFVWPWLFLGQHHHLEYKVGYPFLAKTQPFIVLPDGSDRLQHARIREVVLVENVVDGALCHRVNGLLEERGKAQFKLHKIAHEHHEVLCEVLELYQIHLNILQLMAIFPDAGIYFLKEVVVCFIQFFQHFAAMRLLSKAQLIVLCWYTQRRFVRP